MKFTGMITSVALILPMAMLGSVSAQAGATLTLSDAIQTALENSPTYDSAEKNEVVNRLQYRSSIAKLLPSIDFSSTDGLQNNIPIASNAATLLTPNPTAPWYSTLNLGITENLYDNGVSLTGLAVADLSQDVAEISSLKVRDNLVLNVADEFYTYSLSSVLLEVRKQQQALLEKQFDLLSSQYQQGFKTRADFLRLKTQVQQAEIDRIEAEDALTQSGTKLRQILGINLKQDTTYSFTPVSVAWNEKFDVLKEIHQPSLDQFYDTRIAKLQNDINEKSVDLVRRNYYPQVDLTTGANYNNQSYLNSTEPFSAGHQLSWDALITVQYNLWDWGIRKRAVQIAEGTRDMQADTITLGLQQDQQDLEGMMGNFAKIKRNFRLSRELLGMQEESNSLLEAQYREGKVTYLDLITSLNGLLNSKIQFCTSYFDVLRSLAKYDYYKGQIYDSLLKK
jgi:outer membrane protein TolC